MARTHPFGHLLKQIRTRIPGLTQARLAELAGYDPAVISRMAQGRQDLTGPEARARVLHLIQTLDQAGALRGLGDANALLAAAALSPLIEARYLEAGMIHRIAMHGDLRGKARYDGSTAQAPEEVIQQARECSRAWDRAGGDAERAIALAAAGELAMRHGQERLGMRLLARAALDEGAVAEATGVLKDDFVRQLKDARDQLEHLDLANAWAAGQMLTSTEAGAWLAILHTLIGRQQ